MIPKDQFRIAKLVPFKVRFIKHFFHITCAFKSFLKARTDRNIIKSVSDVCGLNLVPEDIISQVTTLIDDVRAKVKKDLYKPKSAPKQPIVSDVEPRLRVASLKPSGMPSLKVLFTNADQLTSSKMIELKKQIHLLKPHIIAICEVKRKNKDILCKMDYDIPGYSLHPLNLDNDIGRGIAIFTIKALDKSVHQIKSNNDFEESCLLEVRLRGGDVLLFGCIYRSPTPSISSAKNNDNLNDLLKFISNKNYTHRCLVGDFNYRDINWVTWTTSNAEHSDDSKF